MSHNNTNYLSHYLSLSLSVSLPVCLSTCLITCLSVYLSVYPSLYLPVSLSTSLSTFSLPVSLLVCLPVYLSVYLSVSPPVSLPACLPTFLSSCPSLYLSLCPPVSLHFSLPVRLSTCLSARLSGSQVDDGRSKGAGLPDTTAAVADHAAGVGHQLDELVERDVLHRPEVGVLLNALLPHHAHHLLTSCGPSKEPSSDTHSKMCTNKSFCSHSLTAKGSMGDC